MIDWLLAPLSGALAYALSPVIMWHARCMVLAWGVIIPLGVLVARYWKIWPGQRWPHELDSKVWWHSHRFGQSFAVAVMSLGAYLAWRSNSLLSSEALQLHSNLGWSLVFLGWAQVLGGWLRGTKGGPGEASVRGDHFDMTQRRRLFEWTHKVLGWLALALACLTIILGLVAADAPRWMMLSLFIWWAALIVLGWRWQRQAKCVDTYQAIWGLDSNLPGMRLAPIGIGIKRIRFTQDSARTNHLHNTYPLEGDKP